MVEGNQSVKGEEEAGRPMISLNNQLSSWTRRGPWDEGEGRMEGKL